MALLAGYTYGVVLLLRKAGLWAPSLTKDTIVWFLFAGLALAASAIEHSKEERFWRDALAEQLKALVIIEWIVSSYTFSLPVELALVPMLVGITLFDAVAATRAEFKVVSRITTAMLALAGLSVLVFALVEASQSFRIDDVPGTIQSTVQSPLLTAALLPAVFALAIFATYENLIIRLGAWRTGRGAFGRYAALRIMIHCRLQPHRVHHFSRKYLLEIMNLRTRSDLTALLMKAKTGAPSDAETDS
jgi:hypothetical protein